MSPGRNRDKGNAGEDRAAAFLEENKFSIIARNFRFGRTGEIDIVAAKGSLIIFAEVKYRESGAFGGPLYSISAKKKKSLKTAARAFLSFHPEYDSPEYTFRFDLLSDGHGSIEWVEDIFR